MMNYDCEIYLITCLDNDKKYVGKALKTVGATHLTWGTQGRWLSHIREANICFNKKMKGHCVILNKAILKYGTNKFEVKKICDCMSMDADNLEQMYIDQYNTIAPNGYNLTSGGNKGKASDETRMKMREAHTGKSHSDETRKKISAGQLGNKRCQKSKHPEDQELPKYIVCHRVQGKKIGYGINNFPRDRANKDYFTKDFISDNDTTVEQCYEHAIKELSDLEQSLIIKQEATPIKVERTSRNSKKGADKYDMPKYVSLSKKNGQEDGFFVDGLRLINEDGSVTRYRKKFNDTTRSMQEKLQAAKDHLEFVKKNFKCVLDDIGS